MDMARRSSRSYRTCQSQSTSNSSVSSNRADRATRSSLKAESPEKVTQPSCLTSEPLEESVHLSEGDKNMYTRRKRSRIEEHRDKPSRIQSSQAYNPNNLDEGDDDDEAVRCICGLDDYPGPPQLMEEGKSKTREVTNEQITSTDAIEDLAGFFLQCDVCKVWQHGACVGIENEGSSPEEYFCERCRKDLHKIFTASNGQRYSHYLPLHQNLTRNCPRTGSSSKDELQSPKGSRSGRPSSHQSAISKKRSTMNSRDAAYDEEEQLRRAIEASKDEKVCEITDSAPRRAKRGRSYSEEKFNEMKRQRTNSSSPSLSQEFNQISSRSGSDDGLNERSASCKKIRGNGPKHIKVKDLKADRDKSKLESAGRRNERSERRRYDVLDIAKDSQVTSNYLLSTNSDTTNAFTLIHSHETQTTSQIKVSDAILANQNSGPVRKGGRPPSSRKGKLGRNQYTKDRDLLDHYDQLSLTHQSRDILKMDENLFSSCIKGSTGEGKFGRLKGNPSKLTMTDMKRRVAAILEFISRTQLEMASETPPQAQGVSSNVIIQELTEGSLRNQSVGNNNHPIASLDYGGISYPKNDFKDLSCRDMMDVLTKQLIKWQKEFL